MLPINRLEGTSAPFGITCLEDSEEDRILFLWEKNYIVFDTKGTDLTNGSFSIQIIINQDTDYPSVFKSSVISFEEKQIIPFDITDIIRS